ncbi:MAG: alanine--tRNA ligase [Proteobacteria bacterium]|nr:alanine--tRNA ligase [Pseudomonadota bacterium]
MKSSEIRTAFLNYFKDKSHTIVSSSSLIPGNDPTLLFTNAGMVQFKDVFLGVEKSPYTRAVTSQKCVRAGGKHNDLENVGYTARHHTFFEMLGNFSFGDYFKREAIQFAWDFLTKALKIPAEKLWITIFEEDDEAADIWLKEIKVDPARFSRCGAASNFWSMGDTGPCGPCSEIFYDHGPHIAGGPPGSPNEDGDRYVEIWNLVFMQYDRSASGELSLLPKPSVDTGMGLERISAVLQGVNSNYDTDLFVPLLKAIAHLAGSKDHQKTSFKVIADHIRSCSFLIADGVIPSNEGRGYVLRRIIRRAIRHGHSVGLNQEPFFYQLVTPLVKQMGDAYPELVKMQNHIEKVLLQEEEQFNKTLDQGLKILEQDISKLSNKIIPGDVIFKLYDTYGFPADLTGDIARERGLELDMPGFEKLMSKQRQQSQQASQFGTDYSEKITTDVTTDFTGYESFGHEAKILALFSDSKSVKKLSVGEKGLVILDCTPFYAESGGQVGDSGRLRLSDGSTFEVKDTQKQGQAIVHYGEVVQGTLKLNDSIEAVVNIHKRKATMLNHSATHLLHAALHQVLGEHVVQKGSLVEPDRLRFDFSHFEAIKPEQLHTIERLVNQKIRENFQVETEIMTPDEAKQKGAMALFGEKYGEKVRVLSMGDFSKELCGGTHVQRTGDIGFFKITSESGIAAGIRRIEAVTGERALNWLNNTEGQLDKITQLVKADSNLIVEKVQQLLDRNRQLEKEIERLQSKVASSVGGDLATQAKDMHGTKVLVTQLENAEPKSLRQTLDQLKQKLGSCVIVLIATQSEQVHVVAGISKDCIGKAPKPADLVAAICGKGGGRDDMAQGGGALPQDLDNRLHQVMQQIKTALEK